MSKMASIQLLGKRQRLLEWSRKGADCRQSGMFAKKQRKSTDFSQNQCFLVVAGTGLEPATSGL